jgi:hypothetical protein
MPDTTETPKPVQPVYAFDGNENYSVFVNDKVALIIDARPEGLNLSEYTNFSAESCFIYATTIKVDKDIIFEGGKNVTISCDRLEITASEPVKISVAGKLGDSPKASTVRTEQPKDDPDPLAKLDLDHFPGGGGGDAGSLSLVVFEGLDQILRDKKLSFDASGGKGHDGNNTDEISHKKLGWNNPELYPRGGSGGDGGNGGT